MLAILANRRRIGAGLVIVVRVVLGCVFVYSGLVKIQHPYDFLSNLYAYELTGPRTGILVAVVLPWLEVMLGICLVSGLLAGGAMLSSAILLAGFCLVQASAIHRGLEISCGCFGSASDDSAIGYGTLVRTALMALAAGAGLMGMLLCRARDTGSCMHH